MTTTSTARAWIQAVAAQHLPKTSRTYSWRALGGSGEVNSRVRDMAAFQGKVVDSNDLFWLFKLGGNEFVLLGKELCQETLRIGDVCICTPYSRREFDGHRHCDARIEEGTIDGVAFRRMTVNIGSHTSLPKSPTPFVTQEMGDMVLAIESECSEEGRSIAHILIDAGAMLEPVQYQDSPSEHLIADHAPTITFRVKTGKHDGYLAIYYRRVPDCYGVLLLHLNGTVLADHDCIFAAVDGPSGLAELICDLVDDGAWRYAAIEFKRRGKILSAAAIA